MTDHQWHGLAVFDLDGTLLRGPTVCEVLAAPLGKAQRMAELESFRSPSERERQAAREEMARWYRAADMASVMASLGGAQLAEGAACGLSLLRAHRVAVAIASITWSFAVEHFARALGVEHWLGTELQESGEIVHVWPEDKARWVKELAQRLGVPVERTAAIGDSRGDVEMLSVVGLPIFVGHTLPAAQQKWLHRPEENIEWVAKHLLQVWGLSPTED